jgi:hypothetical protein
VQIEEKPAPGKPTPPPKPKAAEFTDDDAAAALLSIDDATGVSVGSGDTAEDRVPAGSTITEIPSFTGDVESAAKEAAPKPDDKTKKDKAKHATGAAQDAAKAILDKIRQGKRK